MGKWVETEGLIQTKKYSTCYPHEKKKLKPTSKNRYNKDIRDIILEHTITTVMKLATETTQPKKKKGKIHILSETKQKI